MKRCAVTVLTLLLATWVAADSETALVVKVRGVYAIIDKGHNQGITKGQELYVKRLGPDGLVDVCRVRVIRTTPNRAAVQQLTPSKRSLLEKGDRLYDLNVSSGATEAPVPTLSPPAARFVAEDPAATGSALEAPVRSEDEVSTERSQGFTPQTRASYSMIKPWLNFNVGMSIPSGDLAQSSPSFRIGGGYMIATGYFNFGVEVNNTFFGGLGSHAFIGSSRISSASLLEALVVVRRFMNPTFFVEGGGGIYRPKVQAVSLDDVKSSFASANFGIFGGIGLFLPTSPYAGIILKGRWHNYFDQGPKQFFGLTGGFRFKVR